MSVDEIWSGENPSVQNRESTRLFVPKTTSTFFLRPLLFYGVQFRCSKVTSRRPESPSIRLGKEPDLQKEEARGRLVVSLDSRKRGVRGLRRRPRICVKKETKKTTATLSFYDTVSFDGLLSSNR